MISSPLRGVWLGRRPYQPVLELQEKLHAARRADAVADVVLLLEHTPVITLGRGTRDGHILAGERRLGELGVDLVPIGRGGDVTLHAPGQLVAYPIIKLLPGRQDVRRYVADLTATMNTVIGEHGVNGGTKAGMVGLWVDGASPTRWPGEAAAQRPLKIGAVGVRISRWVTMHGFALNLTTAMELFSLIVPCGISEFGVVSLAQLSPTAPAPARAAATALDALLKQLGAPGALLEDWSDVSMAEAERRLLVR